MAYPNKIIRNPLTGQDIKFLQTARDTDGALLEMESTYAGHSTEPAPHYHPQQAEDFTVLSGELSVRVNGEIQLLKAGDSIHLPANTVHGMWNHTDQPVVVNWQVRPALDTEQLLETGMGLATDGKTNARGMPGILQVALMARRFSREFRLARPPFWLQKTLFFLLAPFARLAGYQATYPDYLD